MINSGANNLIQGAWGVGCGAQLLMHIWALAQWSRHLIIRGALLVLCSNPPIVRKLDFSFF